MTTKNALEKLTDAQLADRWGAAKAELKDSEQEIEAFKDEFERRELKIAEGRKFIVLKEVGSQTRLNSKAVKAEMGVQWYKERSVESPRVEYHVTAKGTA
jgi:hypothetical protein